MPGDTTHAERRAALDRRLESALDGADRGGLSLARESVLECPDRWYGQLTALSYATAAATSHEGDVTAETVLSASTALELLRGYCRLRSELLAGLDDEGVHAPNGDPTAALLAGDYLNSAAYAALGSVDHARTREAFEVLVDATETTIRAFDAGYVEASVDGGSFLEQTAGGLGECAAVVGATLAGAGGTRREALATLGRSASTARQAQRVLDADDDRAIAPPGRDEDRLREYATSRLEATERALEGLAAGGAEQVRAFVTAELPDLEPE